MNKKQDFDQDDLGQISLNVPYRKITSLHFKLINYKKIGNQYRYFIQLQYKLAEATKITKPIIIQRSFSDFQWLANNLKNKTKLFLIVPLLETLEKWTQKLTNLKILNNKNIQEPIRYQNQSKDKENICSKTAFQFMMIDRFLKIISEILLKYMYKPGQFQTPLFIFIQEKDNFDFYRTLQDQEKKKDVSLINNYWNGFLDYSKNIVKDYIPVMNKKAGSDQNPLNQINEEISNLLERGYKLQQKIKSFKNQLMILGQNFMQKRQVIKTKTKYVQKTLSNIQQQIKLCSLIKKQIEETIQNYFKFIQNQDKQDKQVIQDIKKQLNEYIKFVKRQRSKIFQVICVASKQFISVSDDKNELVQVKISDLYSNFKQISC